MPASRICEFLLFKLLPISFALVRGFKKIFRLRLIAPRLLENSTKKRKKKLRLGSLDL
jgi:hypothetical protein